MVYRQWNVLPSPKSCCPASIHIIRLHSTKNGQSKVKIGFGLLNEEKWGLPQAIEVTIETADPQMKDSEPYTLRARIPIRTANQRRSREDLTKMLGTAE